MLGPLVDKGSSKVLLETQHAPENTIRVVPGGLGLIINGRWTGGDVNLGYLPRQGGHTALATSKKWLSYDIDSSGCALVYDLNSQADSLPHPR